MGNKLSEAPLPTGDPNHILKILVQTSSGQQAAWLHLFLPKLEDDIPYFRVVSGAYQLNLDDSYAWETIDASGFMNLGDTAPINVHISRFAWRSRSRSHFSQENSETTLWGIPFQMTVCRQFEGEAEDGARRLTISLSPNRHIAPTKFLTPYIDGQRILGSVRKYGFRLSDEVTLEVDQQYCWSECGNRSHPYLVAEPKGDLARFDGARSHEELDDAITLLSLLTANRTQISRVSEWVGHTQTEAFFPRFGFPEDPGGGPFDRGLVKLQYLQEYFNSAWLTWTETTQKQYLRAAVFAFLPGSPQVVTLSFLRMFAAVEGLLKAFGPPLDGAANSTTQNALANDLRLLREDLVAKNIVLEQMESVDTAIKIFSRPSMREKFNQLCKFWQIPTDDLWPMFESKSGLYEIRNRLIHGGEVSEEFEDTLWVANQHLMFVLLRIVCRVLGLSLGNTHIGYQQADQGLTMFTKFAAARAAAKKL